MKKPTVVMASDHAGIQLKNGLSHFLKYSGYSVQDLGTYDTTPVDYPDFAEALGLSLIHGEAERGILICGSGVGASIAANKLPGIRAGLCHDSFSAHQGVEDDDMNVLVLGARVIGEVYAQELAEIFLRACFSGQVRHIRRLKKVMGLEARYSNSYLQPIPARKAG